MSAAFPKPARRNTSPAPAETDTRNEKSGRGKAPDKRGKGGTDTPDRKPFRAGRAPQDGPGRPRIAPRPVRPPRPVRNERPEPSPDAATSPDQELPPPAPLSVEDGQTPLQPGVKPVLELLLHSPERVDVVFLRKGRHSRDMDRIADLCRGAGVRFTLLDPQAFARIYAGSSQGVVARLYEAGYVELDELLRGVMDAPLPLLVALDQVQDPGNAGTLARTLYALGGAGLIAPRHNGVYLGAAAAKAAAGALDLLPVCRVPNLSHALESARDLGFTIYGASGSPRSTDPAMEESVGRKGAPPAGPPVLDPFTATFRLPAILVLGNEDSGIRQGTEKRCDFLLRVPLLRAFDSLNVAQAGGIIISCFAREARKR